jgi:RNA polymerase sigma-70 factor (ECF subfamily)
MDQALLCRIADHDSGALAQLYDRHATLLFALIVRILRDRTEAEDALQDVFLRVWQRAETYNPVFGTPSAWLVRIARNRAIDRLRRRRTSPPANAVEAAADVEAPAPGPDESAIAVQQQHAIAGALASLAPEQRRLIECAYFEGYTQTELAAKFALPLGTVKTRIRRGMQMLREQLPQMQPSYVSHEQRH